MQALCHRQSTWSRQRRVVLDSQGWLQTVGSTCDAVKLSEDRFLACLLEVTGRGTMEESLRQSEQRYRNLVELSPDAVFVNRNNRVVLVNPAAVQLFGADNPRQILGRSPFELFHADYHPIIRERIAGLLEGRVATLIEGKIVRLDGTVRFAEIAASPYQDSEGSAIQVVLRDITDRKRVEGLLRANEEFQRDVLNALGAHIAVLDRDGMVIAVNSSWERFGRENGVAAPTELGWELTIWRFAEMLVGSTTTNRRRHWRAFNLFCREAVLLSAWSIHATAPSCNAGS